MAQGWNYYQVMLVLVVLMVAYLYLYGGGPWMVIEWWDVVMP